MPKHSLILGKQFNIMKYTSLSYLVLLLSFLACETASDRSDSSNNATDQLHALFQKEWGFRMQESPMWATSLGINKYNDRLPSASPEDAQRRADYWRNILEELAAIDRSQLSDEDQVNYDLFKFILDDDIAQVEFESYLIPITSDGGFHTSLVYNIKDNPFNTAEDYQNYIKRLQGVKKYMDQHINLMRIGLEKGWSIPQVVLKDYEMAILPHLSKDPTKSYFYQPFQEMPEQIAQVEGDNILQLAKKPLPKVWCRVSKVSMIF